MGGGPMMTKAIARYNLMTTQQVAEILQVGRPQIYGYIQAGELDAIDVSQGRKKAEWRVHPEALDAFLEARRGRAGRGW
jgi:excisionase family DNA binding protein